MGSRKELLLLLQQIDGFKPANWNSRVSDIPRGAKYPYKFVLIQSLCFGIESSANRLMGGELSLDEILPFYTRCLRYLPKEFAKIRQKTEEVAQPISRLARDEFWNCYDLHGRRIDFAAYTTQRINRIKKISQLQKLEFDCCKLPRLLRSNLESDGSRKVIHEFLNAKIENCQPQ